ncbi:tyrosine--tRNA ligase, partial [Candidatus Gracilibacteria bacterium]|nr:tyrosine--tRNA ligase [Candidatus Gracilibacteria bacterium]
MKPDIKTLLDRGTVEVIVRKDLEEKLKSGKKLKVKLGIDPSGADLHLGHMVVIKKLREFQEAGHQIDLLFGNFTGQIGDPTDKLNARKPKTQS